MKRAAALASRTGHSTETKREGQPKASAFGFDGHGHEAPGQLKAVMEKQIAEAPFKRTRLRKVGEIANSNDESNLGYLASNNEDPYDSEEASMEHSPSTVTIVSSYPP